MSDLHRPNKIHRTLVWGGWYGSRNIGDTAILLGIKELFQVINSDRHYYLNFLSTDVDYTNTNGVSGKQALIKSDVLKPWRWWALLQKFHQVDNIIVSGGTPIFDYSHAIRTLYFLLPIMLRRPFIIFGAGVKPITSRYGKWYIPFTLKHAQYVSVRDQGSQKILEGLGVKNVHKTADSAFFAPAASEQELSHLLSKYDLKSAKKMLVVAPRLMSADKKRLYLDEDMSTEVIEDTPIKIAKAIDEVAANFDRVVLMAMHYYGPDSDVPLIKYIMSLVKAKNVTFIDEEMRPTVAIALFKHAYVVMAMRLHALLLSSSMYTPIVGIAYEQKVKDLFKRLDLQEYVVDLFNFTDTELVSLINITSKKRSDINTHLKKRVSRLRKLVLEDAKTVLKISNEYTDA